MNIKAQNNVETAEVMTEIKELEKKFKQKKAEANLACQQRDYRKAGVILKQLRKIVD